MGYSANSVDVDFTVPADKVAEALAAFNATLTDDPLQKPGGYATLADAADEYGGFSDSDNPGDSVNHDGFALGFHTDSWWDNRAVPFLEAIAPFAAEGSCVRLIGEDDALWGYRVVDGVLKEETGTFTWELVD